MNQYVLTINDIIKSTNCKLLEEINHDINISYVTHNTKDINQDNVLFFALKGNTDGHKYVAEAINKGAFCIVEEVPRNVLQKHFNKLIIVDDCLKALQDIARYKREQSNNTVFIGITGSVGKTTTKDIIAHILSIYGKTYKNKGNYNNHIGLPLTILNMPLDSKYCLLELGVSYVNDMDLLVEIAKPNISIILNIEDAHIGNFKNSQEIALEKSKIIYNNKICKLAIINGDSKHLDIITNQINKTNIKDVIMINGNKKFDVQLISYKDNIIQIKYDKHNISYKIGIDGRHNAMNSLFVFPVLKYLGLNYNECLDYFKDIKNSSNRGEVFSILYDNNHISLIDDSYNACKASMIQSLHHVTNNYNNVILILGDMLELGSQSELSHKEIINYINFNNVKYIFTVGKDISYLYDSIPESCGKMHYDNVSDFDLDSLLHFCNQDVTILIKGSNGIKLNNIVERIKSYAK